MAMGKKKNNKTNGNNLPQHVINKIFGRRGRDELFVRKERYLNCLYIPGKHLLGVIKLDHQEIKETLAFKCRNIEQQILALRECTQLTKEEYEQRYKFTKLILNCLFRHHRVIYEGILFGSTVNGLGFKDSDVDLRLRPLTLVNYNEEGLPLYEPSILDDTMVMRTLTDIAFQTTRCSPAAGVFVPSFRVPVAKLTFMTSQSSSTNLYSRAGLQNLEEGLKYDITLSANNFLGPFNSLLLRFFCHLEPKFHLLATVVRYWSSVHNLILPGILSSYALVNMLIFFCQTTQPPLLPTIDQMRETYLKHDDSPTCPTKGLTQLEWSCLISMDETKYKQSQNSEPLCILLLKFFEMYLKFPYSTHIISTRPGEALELKEFKLGPQFHPRFPIKPYLNIQDPFDLKHNLTSGMQGEHFQLFMLNIRFSYERLFDELMNSFCKPHPSNWGLNAIFVPLTIKELNSVST